MTGKWLFPRAALDRWVEARLAQPAGFLPANPPLIIGGSHDPLLEWAARRSGSGLAWSFVPAVAAQRLNPPPFGQAGAILAVVLVLTALLLVPSVRLFFRTARVEKLVMLVMLGLWRPVYGSALLALGQLGGLQSKFFWSAAIGDIAVGIWAATILWRGKTAEDREVAVWNVVGLLDLSHVLVLGALHLREFYLVNPTIAPFNLSPMAGGPLFLALHPLTRWGLWARRGGAR